MALEDDTKKVNHPQPSHLMIARKSVKANKKVVNWTGLTYL